MKFHVQHTNWPIYSAYKQQIVLPTGTTSIYKYLSNEKQATFAETEEKKGKQWDNLHQKRTKLPNIHPFSIAHFGALYGPENKLKPHKHPPYA
ncbi:hypothetical protein [uncultured Photobacterium sp.]|uniref:hypothetical protein n=1 Tax=uncultured Photobacterium sp. TaxID=173973 RepID=UPI002608556E|nr:hypothetical protein [uncultured Photobacterium sp.]